MRSCLTLSTYTRTSNCIESRQVVDSSNENFDKRRDCQDVTTYRPVKDKASGFFIFDANKPYDELKEHSRLSTYFFKFSITMFVISQLLLSLGILFLVIRARPGGILVEKPESDIDFRIANLSDDDIMKMAKDYSMKVNREGKCKLPMPKLIPIIPEPHKKYTPHCAILHRCSNDSGCCQSDKQTCQPKQTETVFLPFRVKELVNGNRPRYTKYKPILLKFLNHTECWCQKIEQLT